MAYPAFGFNTPPAYMGYVGFVEIQTDGGDGGIEGPSTMGDAGDVTADGDFLVRALSADVNLTQEITTPDVVDSRFDRTVYQLGPRLIDGSVSFPAIYEIGTAKEINLFELLYRYAVTRDDRGLLSSFDLGVKYATSASIPNKADFIYKNCIVNTWQFSVSQSDVVTCTFDIMGTDREDPTLNKLIPPCRSDSECTTETADPITCEDPGINSTRIVTWNDARVELAGGRLNDGPIGGEYIRSFEANINNDAERYFTLNTQLAPQAIAPRKREISGNVVLMGRNDNLGNLANTNQLNCSERQTISFGYDASGLAAGVGCPGSSDLATFNTMLINCVFEIETMSLTNDLFESTINWYSLPAAGTSVCDPMIEKIGKGVFNYYEGRP